MPIWGRERRARQVDGVAKVGGRIDSNRWYLSGLALNAAMRLSIGYFLLETLRHPDDPRFAGKAIPMRNLLVVGGLSLLMPALHLWRRQGKQRYPVWTDNLYLSIFWLDMAGNSFNLYNRYLHFDLIPHAHGTGAVAVVFQRAFDLSPTGAFSAANGIHALLEAQEYATDIFFGTHNVRGWWDSAGDVAAGLLGSALYLAAAAALAHLQKMGKR